jgi:hypothetical protein
MSGRLARDDEVRAWQVDGWALLDGLVATDEIDAAVGDLWEMFPTPEQYHADPESYIARSLIPRPTSTGPHSAPASGPATRAEQFRWRAEFPFRGSGALSRLCVHPAIVDFAERALQAADLRLYQVQANAKYTGDANYEQPLHTDGNHSLLTPRMEPPWWHVQVFLYLSDVKDGVAPTHIVSLRDSVGRPTTSRFMPDEDPDLYAAELPAPGVRGSVLVYRTDVFHRGVDLHEPGGSRFLLNLGYKVAGQDWIGYHAVHSRTGTPDWVRFVESSTPRELELFGFPPPGHPIWTPALVDATSLRYPNLDVQPWREAISSLT